MFFLSLTFFALAVILLYMSAILGLGILTQFTDDVIDSGTIFFAIFCLALGLICLAVPAYGLAHLVFVTLI